jgi:hypothetical protein
LVVVVGIALVVMDEEGTVFQVVAASQLVVLVSLEDLVVEEMVVVALLEELQEASVVVVALLEELQEASVVEVVVVEVVCVLVVT